MVGSSSLPGRIVSDEPQSTASSMFQTALTGKTLLLTAKTHVTSGFFKDVTGHDTLEAQLCGLENLRLWQDPETKAVQATVRYTADFKDNYLTFYRTSVLSCSFHRDSTVCYAIHQGTTSTSTTQPPSHDMHRIQPTSTLISSNLMQPPT